MPERRVLVAGATGLIGRAAIRAFLDAGWEVAGLSRVAPLFPDDAAYTPVSADLRDGPGIESAISSLPPVTHLAYAAVFEKPGLVAGWSDPGQMDINREMLRNVLGPLVARGFLDHVTIMQGTKAYGVHLHPIPLPARERLPRDPHENFYWLQEDLLRETARAAGFHWTILRPVQVVGPAFGVGYCTPPVIGVLATVCALTGEPFGFPGIPVSVPKQVADVRLVADALVWSATEDSAHGEHFNLTNGEVFSWLELWPALGEELGVEVTEPVSRRLGEFLPAHADIWEKAAIGHNLAVADVARVLGQSHFYADYTFGYGLTQAPPPALVSTVKIKQAGFTQVRDTEETFRDAIRALQESRILPKFG